MHYKLLIYIHLSKNKQPWGTRFLLVVGEGRQRKYMNLQKEKPTYLKYYIRLSRECIGGIISSVLKSKKN